jgi:hypothetical protein
LRNKVSIGEYLAFLSIKYSVDPDRLFSALISAWQNQESKCENLTVRCRNRQQDKIVILITNGSKVVAQFPIRREFLLEKGNPIKEVRKTKTLCRHQVKNIVRRNSLQVRDLRMGMRKVDLKAKVIEIAKPTLVFTRFGNYANVANALVADETGAIKLCLWNDQINSIAVGDTVQIENARISTFRGEKQLRIGKNGTLRKLSNLSSQEMKTA